MWITLLWMCVGGQFKHHECKYYLLVKFHSHCLLCSGHLLHLLFWFRELTVYSFGSQGKILVFWYFWVIPHEFIAQQLLISESLESAITLSSPSVGDYKWQLKLLWYFKPVNDLLVCMVLLIYKVRTCCFSLKYIIILTYIEQISSYGML